MIELLIIIVSVLLNVFFAFYIRWLLKNLNFLSENTVNIVETIENFSNHLSAIHELEMFYGDDTIQNLMTHARQTISELELYKDVYTLTNEEVELKDIFNDETETEEEGKEEE